MHYVYNLKTLDDSPCVIVKIRDIDFFYKNEMNKAIIKVVGYLIRRLEYPKKY